MHSSNHDALVSEIERLPSDTCAILFTSTVESRAEQVALAMVEDGPWSEATWTPDLHSRLLEGALDYVKPELNEEEDSVDITEQYLNDEIEADAVLISKVPSMTELSKLLQVTRDRPTLSCLFISMSEHNFDPIVFAPICMSHRVHWMSV